MSLKINYVVAMEKNLLTKPSAESDEHENFHQVTPKRRLLEFASKCRR